MTTYIIEWIEDGIDKLFREEIILESVARSKVEYLKNRNPVESIQLFEKKVLKV